MVGERILRSYYKEGGSVSSRLRPKKKDDGGARPIRSTRKTKRDGRRGVGQPKSSRKPVTAKAHASGAYGSDKRKRRSDSNRGAITRPRGASASHPRGGVKRAQGEAGKSDRQRTPSNNRSPTVEEDGVAVGQFHAQSTTQGFMTLTHHFNSPKKCLVVTKVKVIM
ncbi:hypothetical protein AAG570_007615 [Ranatra chinensis]|uniref:Uncharacterized protein n=1 Tax=Ranatra chinensis TaxID=642074 RepID=A0ABD0XU30_9HEMI